LQNTIVSTKNAILKTKKVALKQPKVSLIPLLFLELQFFSEKKFGAVPHFQKVARLD
jgi:hypothetical protein